MLKKFKIPIITLFLVLFIDQFIKIYIKSNYPLGEVGRLADWCVIHFTENPGMAFGFEFGGQIGKLTLSIFRILACFSGILYIRYMILKNEHPLFVFSVSLILAGAIGNILDSAFYGLIFDKGTTLSTTFEEYMPYDGIASLNGNGYAPSMFGCVVDMFYFPMFSGHFPDWLPIWGGEDFQFFRPIFNFADASISFGVGIIIVFQKRFSKSDKKENLETNTVNTTAQNSENELNSNPT